MLKRESIISDILRISEICERGDISAAEALAKAVITEIRLYAHELPLDELQLIKSYLDQSISVLKASKLELKKKLDRNKESSKLRDIYHAN